MKNARIEDYFTAVHEAGSVTREPIDPTSLEVRQATARLVKRGRGVLERLKKARDIESEPIVHPWDNDLVEGGQTYLDKTLSAADDLLTLRSDNPDAHATIELGRE